MRIHQLTLAAVLTVAIGALIAAALIRETTGMPQTPRVTGALPIEGELPSFRGATEWLNSPPLTAADLKGKVVLVEFWTYTCINWRRTLPYVRAWAEKYKDQGLVVIGVSTPEFSFEKDPNNVHRAIKEMKMDFPIATDNDYAIWRAFDNQYWPALYFIDAQGHIRHHQFGEGNYDQSEKVIQQLLTEAGAKGVPTNLSQVQPRGAELSADPNTLGSGETYVGYRHAENFASPGGAITDRHRVYTVPTHLALNQWALSGDWTVQQEAAVLSKPGGRIVYRFHARDVNFIMGPAKPGTSIRFRVRIDGQAPGATHGIDVDDQGNGTVTSQGM